MQTAFEAFGHEVTDVAEAVFGESLRRAVEQRRCPRQGVVLAAAGKCGGREMGFASDVELLFVFDPDVTSTAVVEGVIDEVIASIETRKSRLMEIDLRLRPYGRSGSRAVSLGAMAAYFAAEGPAWPFERQALVKLRPIAGDAGLAARLMAVRDAAVFTGRPVDVAAIRGMREQQIRRHTVPAIFHAKLSPGGLTDIEYFVQAQQMAFGHRHDALRSPNTRDALRALEQVGRLSHDERVTVRDAYRFLRRVIDGLRIVRGDARDLSIPPAGSNEREFLIRRIRQPDAAAFETSLRTHTRTAERALRSLPAILRDDATAS